MQHVFLIGAKSLGGYGGYETFINKLTEYHQNSKDIKYHVAVKKNGTGAKVPDGAKLRVGGYDYHNADCFEIEIPEWLKSAQAIYYDCAALGKSIEIIKKKKIKQPIVYIMTCRIGPFFPHYAREIKKIGGKVFLNPDGHEWMRAKWSKSVRAYWKYSEKKMVLGSDLIVCDSMNIEKYIQQTYGVRNTTFIAYGAETDPSRCPEERYKEWLKSKNLSRGEYYLIVGRFVPENNYETIIKEYMKSRTKKDITIITNDNQGFLDELENRLHFKKDPRIKFVGTVYDEELLKKIREEAYGYFHGHEVGGTNPSLLEALGSTKLNLLLKVGFNEEVGKDAALYWTKDEGNLAKLIDDCECLDREELGHKAKKRIKTAYSWEYISDRYAGIWRQHYMDIKEIHGHLLDLMIQFDSLCVENGIQYTLHGGSLLGAVREHGFIPWDDDIDTAMTRAEFHKLESLLNHNDDYYIYGDIKKQFRRRNDNFFWIDIFVCDYIGEGVEKRKKLIQLTLLDIMYKDKNSIKLVNFKDYSLFKQIAYRAVYAFGQLVSRNFKIEKYRSISEDKYLGDKKNMFRSNDRLKARGKIFPSEWMDSFIRVPFENINVSVISKYHEMLCDCYGDDYMTPIRDIRNQSVHDIVRGNVNL